jgi:hypothetical protein
VLYPEFRRGGAEQPWHSHNPHINPLIHRWFGPRSHKRVKLFLRRNIKHRSPRIKKISLANFRFRITLSAGRNSSGITRSAKDGLEDTEDRRSAGRHGNQHVRVRRPQVSGWDSFILDLRWIAGSDTFLTRERCLYPRPPLKLF